MPLKITLSPAALSIPVLALLAQGPADAAPPSFKQSFQELATGKAPIESFRLSVLGCGSSIGYSLQVWGDGVGFLNQEKQLSLKKDSLKAMLQTLSKANFPDLPKDYGAPGSAPPKGKPGRTPAERQAALEVLCNIEVYAGEAKKQVTQFNKGEVNEAFMSLGKALYESVRDSIESAKTVKTLPEGLQAISSNGLSKNAFFLLMNRVVEVRTPGSDDAGWLLRVDGDMVSASQRTFTSGEGKVLTMKLSPKAFASLLEAVKKSQPDQFPPNLYEEVYTDLTIRVLNRSVNVNARQFAGMNPKTHLDKQARFDELVREIESLTRTALKEGKPAS